MGTSRADSARKIIARCGCIIKIVSKVYVMKGGILLRRIIEIIERRIEVSYYCFLLCLEVLIDKQQTTCPKWCSGTSTTHRRPACVGTTSISDCAIYAVASSGITNR